MMPLLFRAFPRALIVVLLLLALLTPTALPVAAQSEAPNSIVTPGAQANQVTIHWPDDGDAATALAKLPRLRFQGYELPMQLFTVRLTTAAAVQLEVTGLTTTPWREPVTPAAPLTPPVLDEAIPTHKPIETVALPTQPLFVLRQGVIAGESIAVVALSPLFAAEGQTLLATALQATVHNATLMQAEALTALSVGAAGFTAGRTRAATELVLPSNPLAAQDGFKLMVQTPGLQRVSGQALAAAGLDLAATAPATLQVLHRGVPVPLEIDGLVGGQLAATSEVRFYAASVGDRWNLTETYWLTTVPAGAVRMETRSVAPATAQATTTVMERGTWQGYAAYDSYQPGADGDHWFQRELRLQAGQPLPTAAITVANRLPAAVGGTLTLSLTMSTRFAATYTLAVQMNNQTQNIQWQATPVNGASQDWRTVVTTTVGATAGQVTLTQSESSLENVSLWFDQVAWQQPVILNLNNAGALFTGLAGSWRYQWQDAPLDGQGQYRLYDVTNPGAPVALTGATASGFQDEAGPRTYLVAGGGTMYEPLVRAHTAVNFAAGPGAQALYIAPHDFLGTLEPLLAHRRSQGYSVLAVDVQSIYDTWSYGQISAEAIRTFLRFARQEWQPAPISVVMVGDGTWDPHNYEQKDHHTNYIPPYLAYVDPWLGEAACENCYVQLDGDDPVAGDQAVGSAGTFFSPDLWIGRFPVKDGFELSSLVTKIIRYESNTTPGAWRNTSIFLADNYIQSVDGQNRPVRDAAGDFARMSDLVIRRNLCLEVNDPVICTFEGKNSDLEVTATTLHDQIEQLLAQAPLRVSRFYYDPHPTVSDPAGIQGWRLVNAQSARSNAVAALSRGAGLVVYNGHANHWQWARLDGDESLPGLVGLNDPDGLANRDQLFIALSMTCMTAQFQKPANSGTTLDERLFLAANGAAAVWGSAGLSVVHGHDALQRGFFEKLWSSPPMTTPLGELITAGYTELLTESGCCEDAAQTFLLLGDPLTPARVQPLSVVHLPVVQQ
jgi:hypothetical protein